MSDTNDKKPIPPIPGWPTSNDQGQPASGAGPTMEDPLAELDRIVNQDFDFAAAPEGQPSAVSQEELRELEQELIRELRIQQGLEDAAPVAQPEPTPVEPAASWQTPVAPTPTPAVEPQTLQPDPVDTVSEALARPHPLAPQQPVAPQQSVQEPIAELRGAQPEAFEPPQPQEPPVVEAPVAPPVAAMPSADTAVSQPERQAPSLDDWSSLIRGGTSDPVDPAPAQTEVRSEGLATSGSYGQLSRSAAPDPTPAPAPSSQPQEPAPTATSADPMSSFRPGQAYEPVAPAQPRVEEPVVAPRQDDLASWSAPTRDGGYEQPSSLQPDPDPYVPQPVPEVRAPVASDPATDPFAAFNQAPVEPSPSYPHPMQDTAPAVDVTGRDYGNVGYGDPQAGGDRIDPSFREQDPMYQQPYADQNGALSDDYPMASGPHGTYADPGVAQAAAESTPYVAEEDYPTLDPDMTAATTPAESRKSRKGLIAALAAVGVIAVGGLIAWGFGQGGSSDSTETPVIEAKTDPVKETPDDPGGKVIPHQNKTVYDRIDGTKSDEGPGNLMPATEQPLALTRDGQTPRVISLSGGETNVPQNTGTQPGVTTNNPVRPKEVRTVVVRPDGTIVTSNAGNAPAAPQASTVDQQLLDRTPSEQAMNTTFNNGIDQSVLQPGATPAPAETTANLPLPRSKPAELVALQQAAQAATPAPAPVQPVAQQPVVLAPPATQTQPAAPRPAAQTNNTAGGYTVQITSQRTPEQARASFNNIQARLPSVLSGYQPDIKAADLGDRGTFYRVRVGSFGDRAGATAFCNSIKAAGGDCLVARR